MIDSDTILDISDYTFSKEFFEPDFKNKDFSKIKKISFSIKFAEYINGDFYLPQVEVIESRNTAFLTKKEFLKLFELQPGLQGLELHFDDDLDNTYGNVAKFGPPKPTKECDAYDIKQDMRKWEALFFFDELIQQTSLQYIKFYSGQTDWAKIERTDKKGKFPNITECECDSNLFFLERLTSLRAIELDQYEGLISEKVFTQLLKNNPNLKTITCEWTKIPTSILLSGFDGFRVPEHSYEEGVLFEKYQEVLKEIAHLDDDKKNALAKLMLLGREIPFKPKASTLFAFLRAKRKQVRDTALHNFENYFCTEIDSIFNKTILLSGTLDVYKKTKATELTKALDSKIINKLSNKVDVVVVGHKTKLTELPKGVDIISLHHFEQLLKDSEERNLTKVDNKDLNDKVLDLLLSPGDENVKLAFMLMDEGGIPKETMPLLYGIYKLHPNLKLRKEAGKVLKRHGGELFEQLQKITKGRNYSSMLNVDAPDDNLREMHKIKDFDESLFAYYLATRHEFKIGASYLSSTTSTWSEKFVLENLNKEKCRIIGAPNEYFLKTTKLKDLWCTDASDSLWKMDFLESLTLEMDEVKLKGNLKIKKLTLYNCKKVTADEFTMKDLEEVILVDTHVNKLAVFRGIDLKKIVVVYSKKLAKNWQEKLQKDFPNAAITYISSKESDYRYNIWGIKLY